MSALTWREEKMVEVFGEALEQIRARIGNLEKVVAGDPPPDPQQAVRDLVVREC